MKKTLTGGEMTMQWKILAFIISLTICLPVAYAQSIPKGQLESTKEKRQTQANTKSIAIKENRLPIAVITGMSGNVWFQREKDSSWKKAMLNLPLYEGDKVKAEDASQATLWLRAGGTIILKPKEIKTVISSLEKQPEPFFSNLWGIFTQILSRSHQKEHFGLSLAIRGNPETDTMKILSPRNAKLLIMPEVFEWTEVDKATEYVLTIGYFMGKDKIWQTKVNGTKFSFQNIPISFRRVTEEQIPTFINGRIYTWEVEAYDNKGLSLASDTAWFIMLPEKEYNAIRKSIELIQRNSPEDKTTKRLLLIAFYEENELYMESEKLLKEAISDNDQPSLHLMLADLYLKLGLLKQSVSEFQKGGENSKEMDW